MAGLREYTKKIALILAASLVLFGCSDGDGDWVSFAVTEQDVTKQLQQQLPHDDEESGTDNDSTDSSQHGNGSVGNTDSVNPSAPSTSGSSDSGGGTCTYTIPENVLPDADGKKCITIPNKVDGKVVAKVTYPNTNRKIGVMAFKVEEGNGYFCAVDGVLFSKDKKTLVFFPEGNAECAEYTIPQSVETIGECAFKQCSEKLKSITAEEGSNLKEIGAMAFSGLRGTAVDLSNADKITKIGDLAFFNDSNESYSATVIAANAAIAGLIEKTNHTDASIEVKK